MAFPIAGSGTTPPLYPVGGTANALQANGFIPQIWSGKLLEKFYASTILAAIANTDYEGEIKNKGDQVKIRTRPTITIKDYRADGTLEIERPEGSVVNLNIDKGKYFNLILDDVMDIQSDINLMDVWAEDAAEQMKIVVDTQVLTALLDTPTALNRGLTAGKISGDINLGTDAAELVVVADAPDVGEVTILEVLLRLGQVLDEQNIPETGRWAILSPGYSAMIKRSELRQAYLSGDSVSMLRNGRIGMVDRFTLYQSNLVPAGVAAGLTAGNAAIFAGHSHGLTFATQMTKVETMRSEHTFGNIMRGLQVYGFGVVDATAIAQAIVTKG